MVELVFTFSLIRILSLGLIFNLLTIHCTNQSLWKSCDLMVKILLLAASIDLPMPLSMTLTGLLKISCQPSVLRISYLIPREAPSREVYNLVAREARVYH